MGNNDYYCKIIHNSNNSSAIIKSLKYNNNINIKSELEKDISSIKQLLNSIMNLTLVMFPKIKSFILSDNSLKSTYQSSSSNTKIFKSIDLGLYYVTFYNTTWYNKVFKMNFENYNNQVEFEKLLNTLNSNVAKKDYEWFYDMFLKDYFSNDNLQKYQILYNIEKLYREADNYYVFFNAIKTTMNNDNELCLFMTYFIAQFMNLLTRGNMFQILSSSQIINANNIHKINIQLPLVEIEHNNPSFKLSVIYDKYSFTDMIQLTCSPNTFHSEECNMCYL